MKKIVILLSLILFSFSGNLFAQQYWVVGGQYATEGQFPWIADLRVSNQHICGGALIAPDWVMTAAHCMDQIPANLYDVRLNTVRTLGPINANGGVNVSVTQAFIHPMFDINDLFGGYDIALLKLAQPVTSITPMNVVGRNDTNNAYATNSPVNVAGWGVMDPINPTSPDTMKWATSKVYNFATCSAAMGGVSNKIFCIGYQAGKTPSGAGAGDSGGPAWRSNNGTDEITGIVSGGQLQATAPDTPGYFTKVAHFRDWIDGVIGTPLSAASTKIPNHLIKVGMSKESIKIYFGNTPQGNYDMSLININGQVVQSVSAANPTGSNFSMDISSTPNGMYMLRIQDESGKSFDKKIFKY